MPTGLGLAVLGLIAAASVPVGGCRGESPVRVVRSESSGVGTTEDITPIEVPAALLTPHDYMFTFKLSNAVNFVILALEAPVDKSARRLGLNRVSMPIKHGDHWLGSMDIELILFGNGTSPLSTKAWDAKVLRSTGVATLPKDSDSRTRLEPLASEAETYYQSGFREPLYWTNEIGLVEARPVVLKDKTCLNCHRDSKLGDVAGIVIARLNPDEIKQIEEWQARRNAKSNP